MKNYFKILLINGLLLLIPMLIGEALPEGSILMLLISLIIMLMPIVNLIVGITLAMCWQKTRRARVLTMLLMPTNWILPTEIFLAGFFLTQASGKILSGIMAIPLASMDLLELI